MLYAPCVSQDNVTDHFTPVAAGIIWLHFPYPALPPPINHSLYDFVSSVLIAWGLIGPVLTGLVVMVGAGGGFSSTFSWQVPGGSLSVSGLLVSLSTLWALPPICLLCCCSEKNRCVDWRTSALCFAFKNKKTTTKNTATLPNFTKACQINLSSNFCTNHKNQLSLSLAPLIFQFLMHRLLLALKIFCVIFF